MRYVTFVLSLTDEYVRSRRDQQTQGGGTDPREVWIDDTLVATQEAIQYLNLLDDGSVVARRLWSGTRSRYGGASLSPPEEVSVEDVPASFAGVEDLTIEDGR